MESGAEISFASEHDNSNSIPPTSTIHQVDFADTKWILVIEKEARLWHYPCVSSYYLS